MRTKSDRMRTVTILLSVAVTIIVVALFNSMVLGHNKAMPEVVEAVYGEYQVSDEGWGLIRDRKGEVLVGISPAYIMEMEVSWVTDTVKVAQQMAPLLDKPEEEVAKFLASGLVTQTNEWIVPWRPFSEAQMQALVDARFVDKYGKDAPDNKDGLPGPDIWPKLKFTQTWVRTYPEGDMCGQTLGFTDMDAQGQYGIEEWYQTTLRPDEVASEGNLTQWVYPLPETFLEMREVSATGYDTYLTIDRTIQAYIEDELERAVAEYNAKGGTIIVMEVETANILAMANYPTYYPSRFWEYMANEHEGIFANPAVTNQYEPGSVFKAITMCAALDSGSIDPNTWSYVDQGRIYVNGIEVPNAMGKSWGLQDAQGVLKHSLNAGVATIVTQYMNPDTYYHYVEAFGFGSPTGITLANESWGSVRFPRDNDGAVDYLTLANNAFGQGIAVTPLQMINAMNVIANDGVLLQPHIVLKQVPADDSLPVIFYGQRQTMRKEEESQVLSLETAKLMQSMLQVVVDESVTTASVPGYSVAGKTGTAQVPMVDGDIAVYDPNKIITSFVGFGPMPDPKIIILVKLDEPKDVSPYGTWGTNTAAPTFSRVAQRVFLLMGYPPDDVQQYNAALTGDL